jgi:hypothetical protein
MADAFDIDIISKVRRDKFLGGRFKDKLIQSIAFDGKVYYIGFAHQDSPVGSTLIVTKDLSFTDESVITQKTLPLYHCNDLEYAKDGKLYSASGCNAVQVVNPSTLSVERVIVLSHDVWSIAQYPDGSWFVFDGTITWQYSQDFTKKQIIEAGNLEKVRLNYGAGYWQGAFMMDGDPFLIYSIKGSQPDYYKGTVFCSDKRVMICKGDREIEGACVTDGVLECVYGQLNFGGAYWDMSQMKTVYAEKEKVKAATGSIVVDLSDSIPDGYKMTAACVNIKKGNAWRELPFLNANGKITMQILKVSGSKVYLKAFEDFGTIPMQITAFCRR